MAKIVTIRTSSQDQSGFISVPRVNQSVMIDDSERQKRKQVNDGREESRDWSIVGIDVAMVTAKRYSKCYSYSSSYSQGVVVCTAIVIVTAKEL